MEKFSPKGRPVGETVRKQRIEQREETKRKLLESITEILDKRKSEDPFIDNTLTKRLLEVLIKTNPEKFSGITTVDSILGYFDGWENLKEELGQGKKK